MKKTITFVVSALTAVTLLASCGGGSAPTVTESTKDEVRQTVTSFMDAFISFDTDEAKKYITDESIDDVPELFDRMEDAFSVLEGVMPEENKQALIDRLHTLIKDNIEYEIGEILVVDNEATTIINATVPVVDNLTDYFDRDDLTKLMQDSFGLDINDSTALLNAYAQKKGVSIEDLPQLFASGDEDDFLKDFYQTFKGEIDTLIDSMVDILDSCLKNAEKEKYVFSVTLEKQPDGQWLISDMD